MRGHSKAVANYKKAGKRKFRNPLKHVRKYVRHVEEELGAQGKPFRIVDMNANPLWEAAGLEEEPLPGVHHTGMAAEGTASQSCTSSNPHTPGDASSCHRQQLRHSLAADPRGGRSVQDPLVRRRCGRPAGCDGVPQVDERAGKEHEGFGRGEQDEASAASQTRGKVKNGKVKDKENDKDKGATDS